MRKEEGTEDKEEYETCHEGDDGRVSVKAHKSHVSREIAEVQAVSC